MILDNFFCILLISERVLMSSRYENKPARPEHMLKRRDLIPQSCHTGFLSLWVVSLNVILSASSHEANLCGCNGVHLVR